jgi:capsular exopolysaccharide synthesis family protein
VYESQKNTENPHEEPATDLARQAKMPLAVPVGGFLGNTHLSADGDQGGRAPKRGFSLASILQFKWTFLSVFLPVAILGIAAIWLLIAPEYEARAEIRVRPIIPSLVFKTEENGSIPFYQSFVNTQVSIIRNPAVLQRVLEQQDVQNTQWYRNPERSLIGQPEPPIDRLRAALSASPRMTTEIIDLRMGVRSSKDAEVIVNAVLDQYVKYISETADKTQDMLYRQLTEQYKSLENEIQGRETVLARLRKDLGTGAPQDLVAGKRIRLDQTEAQLSDLWRQIAELEWERKELDRDQRVKAISERETERLQFASTISDMPDAAKKDMAAKLAKEQEALKQEAAECQKALAAKSPSTQPGASTQPQTQSDDATAQVLELAARLKLLQQALATTQWQVEDLQKAIARQPNEIKNIASRPSFRRNFFEDPEWRQLNAAVTTAQKKLEIAGKEFKPGHPTMQSLSSELDLAKGLLRTRELQLSQLESQSPAAQIGGHQASEPGLARPGGNAIGPDYELDLAKLDRDLSVLKQREALVLAEMKKQKEDLDKVFNSAQLLEKEEQDVAHKRELFNAVRGRLDQKEMEKNVPGSIEVLTRAVAPGVPSTDRRLIDSFMALAVALGLAVTVVFFRAVTSQTLRSAEDLPLSLRTPFLGQLPALPSTAGSEPDLENDPSMTEAARMIRTALLSSIAQDRRSRGTVILISSAGPGAGKSTVTAVLGRSLAECGKKVLLVDADLRKSTMTSRFGLDEKPGLLESLVNRESSGPQPYPTGIPRLSVLPAGILDDAFRHELTTNGAFTARMAEWSRDYDIVLLDSPPILPVADARILAGRTDGAIIVVREEGCRREDLTDAMACLGASGGKLLGTIFIGSWGRKHYRQSSYYNGYAAK